MEASPQLASAIETFICMKIQIFPFVSFVTHVLKWLNIMADHLDLNFPFLQHYTSLFNKLLDKHSVVADLTHTL